MAIPFQAEIQLLRASLEAHLGARVQSDQAPATLPWKSGERLTATVQAALEGSRFVLRIGDRSFDAVLPLPAAVGDQLELEFLYANPRVTFALRASGEAAAPAPAQGAVDISPSARNLSNLLQSIGAAGRKEGQGPAHRIEEPLPLLPAPPAPSSTETGKLAAALQTSVQRSGLFYESHLGAWLMGERPLHEILREPQGRLSPLAAHMPAQSDEPRAPGARTHGLDPHIPGARADAKEDAVAASLLPQVRAQLETLDARQILWQGHAWPGQPMEWRVDEPPEHAPDSEGPIPWTTRVVLTLPRMGEITADLVLAGDTLRLRLANSDAASQAALRAGQGALAEALEQAGIQLSAFRIEAREPG
jgi:hypothetical protein